MQVTLISKTKGVEDYAKLGLGEIISAVARHGNIKEDKGRLVKYLMENKHWSPLQFVHFGFRIETSRAISAQLFRHRSLNHQEWSQRYSVSDALERIEFRTEHETNRQSSEKSVGIIINEALMYPENLDDKTVEAMKAAKYALQLTLEAYDKLIESGVAKETARMILPMTTKTVIHLDGSLRDLLAFLNVRCDHHTQKEAREIAMAMGEILEQEIPDIMKLIDWRKGLFL